MLRRLTRDNFCEAEENEGTAPGANAEADDIPRSTRANLIACQKEHSNRSCLIAYECLNYTKSKNK